MATNTPQEFPTDDIYQSAFLELNDNPAKLTLQAGRVTFLHKADNSLFTLLAQFNDNTKSVPLTRFVSVLKKLRGQMVAMRPTR